MRLGQLFQTLLQRLSYTRTSTPYNTMHQCLFLIAAPVVLSQCSHQPHRLVFGCPLWFLWEQWPCVCNDIWPRGTTVNRNTRLYTTQFMFILNFTRNDLYRSANSLKIHVKHFFKHLTIFWMYLQTPVVNWIINPVLLTSVHVQHSMCALVS